MGRAQGVGGTPACGSPVVTGAEGALMMKDQGELAFLHEENSGAKYALPGLIMFVSLLVVAAALAWNTMSLYNVSQESTKSYADEVSAQLASNISYRMRTRETHVRNIADTVSRMSETYLTEEFLDRKASYLEMTEMFVVNRDGSTIPEDEEHAGLGSYLVDNPELWTDARIFFADHGEVFYSAPIIRPDGNNALLIGTRSNELLQQMLRNVDYGNKGLSCIIDSTGKVIVSATDEAPFTELNDMFSADAPKEDIQESERVLNDIKERQSGIARFEGIGGEPLFLGYDFLGINDWMLLTIVDADAFSETITPFLVRYVVVIAALTLVMAILIVSLAWYYHRVLSRLRAVALTDPLTGGHNSLAFRMGCRELVHEHPEREYAIVYLNIADFKRFNERFGIGHGDELLRLIHGVLTANCNEGELACRNLGDHFYLLLECASEDEVRERLQVIMDELQEQCRGNAYFERVVFERGAYLITDRDADFMLLTDRAKAASAYQSGSEVCRFYDSALKRQLDREHELDSSFEHAIENKEFDLYIQPKVRPGERDASGGEVLVRWRHPKYGLLFPGDFIPLLERSGKVCDLDFYMFEETCKLLRSWLDEGFELPLSVNLSRSHLLSKDLTFLDRLKQIKERYGIPDDLIEMELTESLMLERQEVSLAMETIDRIRSMGALCSIDDFGFGYSSMSLIKDLNVTTVKLDRQFFLDENEKSWVVVDLLIQLAHNLGMTVVAEGVEEIRQVEKLKESGCDLIQGYVYAKPMPVSEFEKWPS